MYALAQHMIENSALIKRVAQFVKRHMDEFNDESCLECFLKRQAKTDRMVHAKKNEEKQKPPTRSRSELESENDRKSRYKR